MGCHTWIYKNVNSLPKKELNEILKSDINHSYFSFIEEDKETWSKSIYDYYKKNLEIYKSQFDNDSLSEEDKQYLESLETEWQNKTIEDCYKEYDECVSEYNRMLKLADKYFALEDNDIELCKKLNKYFNYNYIEVDGIIYKELYFDTIFRVYGYPEETFTDVEKLIEWLYQYDQKSIVDYDDEMNPIEPRGMTERLAEKLRKLWTEHNNSLYVHFG